MVTGLVMNANWKPVRIDTGPLPIEKAIVFTGSDEPITLLMASYSDPGPVAFVVVTVKVAALRPAAVKATARASRSERMDELSFGHAMRRVLIVTAIFAAACASTVPRNSIDLSRARPHRSGDDRAAALHQIAMGANVPGLENIANLDRLPLRGAYVIALPMKIAGGSGGPLRVVALLP